MSDLDQLYPQPLHLPTGQPHNVADVPFAGRAGFADGRRRLNSSNIAAAIQDFETPVPNPSISNFEIGNFGAENAIIYFDGNKITLEQPSGQPYRYDYPGGSVTGIRLVLDVGVELSGGEYFIIEPIIAEAGAQASWQPSFVYIPDEDPPPHPRLLSYEFGVYVRGSGTVSDTGLTQLTMSGVRLQSLYTPLSIPSTEVIHFKQLGGPFASFPIDITHIVKTFDIDVLFAEPVVFEADIYSADDT